MANGSQTTCNNCGKLMGANLRFCPHCGEKQSEPLKQKDINKDPYAILQVSRKADAEVISSAYKTLARKYHPDSGTRDDSIMRELNWAHDILSDSSKRISWDAKNKEAKSTVRQATPRKQPKKTSSREPHRKTSAPPGRAQTREKTEARKSEHSEYPSISKERIVVGTFVAIIIFAVLVLSFSALTENSRQHSASIPTTFPTQQSVPTRTTRPTTVRLSNSLLDLPEFKDCRRWSSVQHSLVGASTCVYGIVSEISGDAYWDTGEFYIYFSNERSSESDDFRILSHQHVYFSLQQGNCIAVFGTIRSYGDNSFTYIDPASTRFPGELFAWDNGDVCEK